MPRYNIGGKWINTEKNLTDADIDEIAAQEKGASKPFDMSTAGPFKYTRDPNAPADELTSPPPDRSMFERLGTGTAEVLEKIPLVGAPLGALTRFVTPGSMRDVPLQGASSLEGNPNTLARAAGATIGAMSPAGPIVGSAIGGAGGRLIEGALNELTGDEDPILTTEFGPLPKEVGKTAVEMAALEGVGQGLSRLPSAVSAATSKLRKAPASVADTAAAKLRSAAGLEEGAAAKTAFEAVPPPSRVPVAPGFQGPPKRINLPEQGRIVGEIELQNLNLRKRVFGEAFKKIDSLVPEGVDITPLLDEAGNLRVPPGTDIPPELASTLKKIKGEARRLESARAAAKPGEVISSEALDKLVAQLRSTPFSQVHKMRSSIGAAIRDVKLRGSNAADIVPLKQAVGELEQAMDASALQNPGAMEAYATARKVWKDEVVGPHYDGAGADISKMMEGHAPTPEQIGGIIPAFGADTVISARQALVPGDWAPASAKAAGQKAFDHLVDQTIRTKLGAKGATDTIDLSTAFDDIQTKIGDAAWQQMIAGSSSEQATRLINMEKAARAYKQIQGVEATGSPRVGAALGGALGGATGAVGGPALSAGGVTAGGFTGYKIAQALPRMKADILRWALEHPARTEILTQGMAQATSPIEASAFAARNIATITRLYNLDRNRPPSRESISISSIP